MSLLKQFAEALLPVVRNKLNQTIDEWAEENISLVGTIEGLEGSKKPNFKDFPDLKEIFAWAQDPDVKEIVLMYSAQTGKTFPTIIIILWWIAVKGYSVMFTLCDENKMNKVRERVKSILKANQDILGWDNSRGVTKGNTFVFNNGGALFWGHLGSPASLDETPCDIMVIDELDPYIQRAKNASVSMVERASNRIQARPHGKLLIESTPYVYKDGGGILDEYSVGKRFVNEMQCPKCNEWSEFQLNDIKCREFSGDIGVIRHKRLGYAVCPKCQSELDDNDHYYMSRNTRFNVVEGDESKSPLRKCAKKAVWGSLVKSWSQLAYEHEKAKEKGALALADFYSAKCANPQSVNVKQSASDLVKLPYSKGFAPPDCQFLVAGVDIGGERIHVSVVGFGQKDRSYLVDWSEHNYGGRSNFIEIENKIHELLLDSDYRTTDGKPLRVLYVAIDSNYYTSDVLRLCQKINQLIPVVGSGALKSKWRLVEADPKNNWGYKNSSLKRYELGHNYFQDAFEARLHRSHEEGSCFGFPQDVWKNYLDHLANMIQVLKPDGVTWEWKQKSSMRRVDWRDTAIYCLALYEILDLNKHIRFESVEKKAQRRGFGHILQK